MNLAEAGALENSQAHLIDDARDLLFREQVRHLTRREDVVDVLDERLILDLRLVEEESGGLVLSARDPIQLLQVLTELNDTVVFGDLD